MLNTTMAVPSRSAAARELHRLVSYNVLSPHLCSPDYFVHCKPRDLEPQLRLKRVTEKLQPHVQQQAIVCLQEVSTSWAGPLHTFFASHNYHLITGLYGDKNSGYMGVALALPLLKYELLASDITRAADTKTMVTSDSFGRQRRHAVTAALKAVAGSLGRLTSALLVLTRLSRPPAVDPWKLAAGRMNQIVSVRLKSRQTGATFVASTYHMPCMFRQPQVMNIHCALAAQHVQQWAAAQPYLLAGDFNIKPGSSMYRLLTEGQIEPGHAEQPPALPASLAADAAIKAQPSAAPLMDMPLRVEPMKSAYAVALGREPELTNNARTVNDTATFIDTLDYIFTSNHWAVDGVGQLLSKEAAEQGGPQPTADEPSDHLLIYADLTLSQ